MVSKIMMESLIILESLTKSYNENISIGLKCLYQIIYILSKIRGVKTLIKFFPSDVFIFENIILFLINLSLEDSEKKHRSTPRLSHPNCSSQLTVHHVSCLVTYFQLASLVLTSEPPTPVWQ